MSTPPFGLTRLALSQGSELQQRAKIKNFDPETGSHAALSLPLHEDV